LMMFGSFVLARRKDENGGFQSIVRALSTTEQLIIACDQKLSKDPSLFLSDLAERASEYEKMLTTAIATEQVHNSDRMEWKEF
jgi:hypothetical protein